MFLDKGYSGSRAYSPLTAWWWGPALALVVLSSVGVEEVAAFPNYFQQVPSDSHFPLSNNVLAWHSTLLQPSSPNTITSNKMAIAAGSSLEPTAPAPSNPILSVIFDLKARAWSMSSTLDPFFTTLTS